jgi:hypothetical protein
MPWSKVENYDPKLQWVKRLEGVWYLIRKKRSYEEQICAVLHEENGKQLVQWRIYNRIYYMRVRWLKITSDHLPHPYCARSYYEYDTFDWGYDSDDEEGTLTAMDTSGKVVWVEDLKSGFLLRKGEMVIPGAGIFRMNGCVGEFADRTGRIVPTNDKWARTCFENSTFDVYENEEWGRNDAQRKARHPRLLTPDEDEPAKHPGDRLYEEIPCLLSPRRKDLQRNVLEEVEAAQMQCEEDIAKRALEKRKEAAEFCKCYAIERRIDAG